MKISLKHQANTRANSNVCSVTEYPMGDGDIDFAIVKVTGRYPTVQRAVNRTCKEIVYVHEGRGRVVVDGEEYALNPGDVILIEAGEKFYWEGPLTLFISCHPAFTIEQHQMVD
jgi:mannose-6-phosphate isomerase-like protein (cupin superfamily)